MHLTITGYSTALFSTWYFIEEWGILFDAGEGLISSLLQKSRKIDQVFISHADRDHITGLLQFNQLNARPGLPIIYYPKDSGSFPALEAFSKQFDPQVARTVWTPVTEGDEIPVAKDLLVKPLRNGHVPVDQHIIKSLGYMVVRTRKKLRPEFAHLSGPELRQLAGQQGRDSFSMELRENLLGYSGDTPVEDGAKWDNTKILIHEATFLDNGEPVKARDYGNKHSTLEEVMEMISSIHIEQLILGHFSSRYSPEDIDRAIRDQCEKYAIDIPVRRLLPGVTVHDLLSQPPING
ncbi:MAG TPA: MBL fold metallo-hydrolase [Puia sp.]|nr:MBL fold metallo-hydrolase [Puia sp.]